MTTNQIHALRADLSPLTRSGEWSSLVKMTPAAFDLVPPIQAAHQGLELISNAAHTHRFQAAVTSMQAQLRDACVPVIVAEKNGAPELERPDRLSRPQRRWLGQVALELYFTQVLRSEVAIVDLWPSRFGMDAAGDALWSPRPLYVRWDAEFREGLRRVYAGFFLDQPEWLDAGLRQLGLGRSGGPLLQHFGEGNQRSVRFDRSELESTLRAMSVGRRPEDPPLHRNFIAFGLFVTSLHELLASLDLAFDVRSAFMRTYPRP
jgi:hypothetical protein